MLNDMLLGNMTDAFTFMLLRTLQCGMVQTVFFLCHSHCLPLLKSVLLTSGMRKMQAVKGEGCVMAYVVRMGE